VSDHAAYIGWELSSSNHHGSEGASGPDRISHFEIVGRLGTGGMGDVYRARDEVLDREVALKLVRPEVAQDEEVRQRFLREARLAAAINHSGVATLFEAGETEPVENGGKPQLYLASELVEGQNLEGVLRNEPLPIERVIDLGVQLAEALAAAHELGIVHRDIKPSNLMVTDGGQLKVLDFGIAKRVGWAGVQGDDAETLTYTARGAIVGTPAYMAPEQVAGGVADARTDIHGAGCVLYQMLTGRGPFGSGAPSEVMRRVIVTPPKPLRTLRAEVPQPLADVVERALAKDPGDRYQTAEELATALRGAAASTGVRHALRGIGAPVPRRTILTAAVVVVVVLSVLVGRKIFSTALPFDNRDWLLVADVVNETGDEGFTLALKSALETDLRQSRHVNIFDEGRVRNTLKMMRRDPADTIDLETGLHVCRFAGVRALLVPRIDAVGDVYILQASLIEPETGRIADRIRLTANGRDEVLLETIDALTEQVRHRLGESMQSIAETDAPLIQYTTSSWEALRLLAIGSKEWRARRYEAAARSFELALEQDPHFAMARGSLGLLEFQFLGKPEEGRQLLAEALEDASDVSRREYLLLRAINRQFVDDDPDAALADYRLISELYPDALQPYNNSGRILQRLGRYEEATRMYERAHEIDPRNPIPLFNQWFTLNQYLRRPAAAYEVARELVELQPESPWARHGLAWSLVALRRFDDAEAGMRAILESDPSFSYALANLAHLLYRRGAFDEAVDLYRKMDAESHASERIDSDAFDSLCLGLALQGAGRADEARTVLEAEIDALRAQSVSNPLEDFERERQAGLLAAVGRGREASALARKIEAEDPDDPQVLLALAEVYALIGEPDHAIALLGRAFDAGYDDPYYVLLDPPLRGLQNRPELEQLAPPS